MLLELRLGEGPEDITLRIESCPFHSERVGCLIFTTTPASEGHSAHIYKGERRELYEFLKKEFEP